VAVKEEYAEAEKVLKIFQAELDDGTCRTFLWWIFLVANQQLARGPGGKI
jgi:hypothetical protein